MGIGIASWLKYLLTDARPGSPCASSSEPGQLRFSDSQQAGPLSHYRSGHSESGATSAAGTETGSGESHLKPIS